MPLATFVRAGDFDFNLDRVDGIEYRFSGEQLEGATIHLANGRQQELGAEAALELRELMDVEVTDGEGASYAIRREAS